MDRSEPESTRTSRERWRSDGGDDRGDGAGGVPRHAAAACGDGTGAGERNRLLRAIPSEEYAWIASRLEPAPLKAGQILSEPNEHIGYVYFPESAVASMVNPTSGGGAVEVGTIGKEGLVGLSVLLDSGSTPSRVLAQVPGDSRRMRADAFVEAAQTRPQFQRVVYHYTHAFLTQVAYTASCNRAHSLAERCARWLLMTHDRVGTDRFDLTHEFLAFMLGVRRAGVTVAAGMLQHAGFIRYSRGRITVLDRSGLEGASCECYGIVRDHFDRVLGPFERSELD